MNPLERILLAQGDALTIPLADESVHCVVTSPPYWALRDYGVGEESGELGSETLPDCEAWTGTDIYGRPGRAPRPDCCHVCNLRLAMAALWRVMHPSGTVWFNYGHMYAQTAPRGRYGDQGDLSTGDHGQLGPKRNMAALARLGIKKGDLVLMRERLALAFQKDGWYVRSHVVWHKPNPMPGPAQVWRRPIDSHEIVYLLAKTWGYYYDAEAVRETPAGYTRKGGTAPYTANTPGIHHGIGSETLHQMAPNGRHKRDVWTIPTAPYPGAHFACYPPALVEPCILAGTSEAGVCPACGWPWKRIVKISGGIVGQSFHDHKNDAIEGRHQYHPRIGNMGTEPYTRTTLYWAPTCDHDLEPVPAVVLDPFVGSGTTCAVAREHGRLSVGLDISHEYLVNEAYNRLGVNAWRQFTTGKAGGLGDPASLPLFNMSV